MTVTVPLSRLEQAMSRPSAETSSKLLDEPASSGAEHQPPPHAPVATAVIRANPTWTNLRIFGLAVVMVAGLPARSLPN